MNHHLHIYAERELASRYEVRVLCGQRVNRAFAHSIFDDHAWKGRADICPECRAQLVDFKLKRSGFEP